MLKRVSAGRLNGMHGEEGTVLGPKAVTREFVVITGNDERGCTVGYATTDDMASVHDGRSARSLTEVRLQTARKFK